MSAEDLFDCCHSVYMIILKECYSYYKREINSRDFSSSGKVCISTEETEAVHHVIEEMALMHVRMQ